MIILGSVIYRGLKVFIFAAVFGVNLFSDLLKPSLMFLLNDGLFSLLFFLLM